jgi:hypothetical protein
MNRNTWVALPALLALLLAGCSSTPPPELTAEGLASTTRYGYGTSAASFVSYEECRYADVQVYAQDSSWKSGPGGPDHWTEASIFLYLVDTCSEWGWDVIVSAHGQAELRRNDFTMTGNLGRARLRTTIDVFDWMSGTTVPVEVDLTWRGVDEPWRWKERIHDDVGGLRTRYRHDSIGRSAEVTGMVDLGAFGHDVTMPGAGWMAQYRSASTTIGIRPGSPVIHYFDAYPDVIYPGGSTALEWWVSGAEPLALSIDQGVGDVSGLSSVHVAPTETTTYTLTATNRRGSDSARFTVYVVPPPEPDAYEPNDDPSLATPMGRAFYGDALTITPADVDWFTFTLDESTRVSIYLWGDFPFYPLAALFDGDLDLVASEVDWFDARLRPGRYYLAVTGYPDYGFTGNHGASGSYTLAFAVSTPTLPDPLEPNDDPAEAVPIVLDYSSIELTITPSDVDWFTFTLTEAATVVAGVEASSLGSSLDALMALFDAELLLIRANDDFYGLDPRIEEFLEPGTYYLAISGYPDFDLFGDHWQEGFYFLSVAALP